MTQQVSIDDTFGLGVGNCGVMWRKSEYGF